MAVHTYVVRLVDIDKKTNYGVNSDANEVCRCLKTWYTSVCQKASSGSDTWNADVQWLDSPPAARPKDSNAGAAFSVNMMIYFVLSPQQSVIAMHPANNGKLPDASVFSDHNDVGLTWFRTAPNGAVTVDISEVYVSRCRTLQGNERLALVLARTAFHESMHNQLALGDALHQGNGHGFADADPTGTLPTAGNIDTMAAKIATLRPQWEEGFQTYKTNTETIR